MSADDELKAIAQRIAKAFGDLAKSQEQLADELARRCAQHAEHFEEVCRIIEAGAPSVEADVVNFERLAEALAAEGQQEQRQAA